MEERSSIVNFEEVSDSEIDDIWDIIFPHMPVKKENVQKIDLPEVNKPRRYMKFLFM